jgi:hypothetical protein
MIWVSPAQADDDDGESTLDKAERIGKKAVIGKSQKAKGLMYAAGIGWEATDLIGLNGEVGYAWGTQRAGLANTASMHHISLAPRINTPADSFDLSLNIGVLIGHTWRALAHFGIEVGPTLLITPDVAAGGLAKVHLGYKGIGLYAFAGASFGDDTDFIGGLGVEMFKLPELSIIDIAKSAIPDIADEL